MPEARTSYPDDQFDAANQGYTPATVGNWPSDTDPGSVAEALDALAGRQDPITDGMAASRVWGRLSSGDAKACDAQEMLELLGSAAGLWQMPASGDFYGGCPFGNNNYAGSISLTADRLYGIPFFIPWERDWLNFCTEVGTAAGGSGIKCAIYDCDGYGSPRDRVWLGGSAMDSSSTGFKKLNLAQALDPGWYYMGFICGSGAVAVNRMVVTVRMGGHLAAGTDAGYAFAYNGSGSYAAGPPATFGSPTWDKTGFCPRVLLEAL